ncbi:MAG: hypothetical protein GXP21_08275 [Gammaproteobacteria bacterium]|nr:hypothetical protein [Gammaproteobacteria bacterium]
MRDDRQSITESQVYPVYYPQDEISLIEIFAVLRRRYLLIISIVVLAVIAAAVYVANIPSVYESRAVFRVGLIGGMADVPGDKLIETPLILIKRLVEDYRVEDSQNRPKLPRLDSVSLDKSSADVVELVSQAHSADDAQQFLATVLDKLLAEHRSMYEQTAQVLGGRLDYLRGVKTTIDNALVDIDHQMGELIKQDTSAAALFTLEKSRLLEQSLEAEGRIAELTIAQDLKSYPSSLLRAATFSDNKVSPKRKLILTLTLILSLILAIILAFIVEFIAANSKNDEGERVLEKP